MLMLTRLVMKDCQETVAYIESVKGQYLLYRRFYFSSSHKLSLYWYFFIRIWKMDERLKDKVTVYICIYLFFCLCLMVSDGDDVVYYCSEWGFRRSSDPTLSPTHKRTLTHSLSLLRRWLPFTNKLVAIFNVDISFASALVTNTHWLLKHFHYKHSQLEPSMDNCPLGPCQHQFACNFLTLWNCRLCLSSEYIWWTLASQQKTNETYKVHRES